MRRRGFSLLEIILALAILAGAIAVLGELARVGLQSARIARDTAYAQLLCESKMAEITSGAYHPEPVNRAPLGTTQQAGQPDWLYSIELAQTDQEGMLVVVVTVEEDLPAASRPVRFSILRWMLDPDYEFAEATSEEESSEKSSSSTTASESKS